VHPGTRDWDASTYDRVSTPQLEWALPVIDRLDLAGDETLLDAGCGSGRVSELLLERLPRGKLIAVDGSAAMLTEARRRLGPAVELIHSDLLELELSEPVDAIFSNAVFHWITDHERLFAVLAACLWPGGAIEAQCGGEGNVSRFREVADAVAEEEPYAPHLAEVPPYRFAGAEETEGLLQDAGFERVRCWLERRPARPPEPREFVRSVCLGAQLEVLPDRLRGAFLDAVMDGLGPESEVELDYVRLNISAVRGS